MLVFYRLADIDFFFAMDLGHISYIRIFHFMYLVSYVTSSKFAQSLDFSGVIALALNGVYEKSNHPILNSACYVNQ
jgi:hypothetical protein